jgi:hypothetical protein
VISGKPCRFVTSPVPGRPVRPWFERLAAGGKKSEFLRNGSARRRVAHKRHAQRNPSLVFLNADLPAFTHKLMNRQAFWPTTCSGGNADEM